MTAPAPQTQPIPPLEPQPAPPRPARRPSGGPTLRRRALDAAPPPKSFDHTGYADEVTFAAGSVVHLTHTPSWWVAVGGVLAMLAVGVWAWERFRMVGVTWFAVGVTACASAWVWWAAHRTPWSWGSLGLLVAGTLALGPVYAAIRWKTDKRNAKELEERAAARAIAKQHQWVRILEDAGAPDISINTELDGTTEDGAVWVCGERQLRAGFALALDLGTKAPDVKGLALRIPEIEKIASRRTRLPIRPGSIQVEQHDRAHLCEIKVPTKDVLREVFPVPDRPGPRSINDPIEVAVALDGTLAWDCHTDPHGMVSGQTDAGKSTFLNAHICETTRSVDCVTWLIAGAKPNRAFAPWLGPFLEGVVNPITGQPVDPVIDWFAPDLYEAVMMLLDAYAAIDRRQTAVPTGGEERWHATPENPAIVIFIDESPDLLASTQKFETHKPGERFTFSELLLKVIRLARSEDIHVLFLTQRGTVSMIGPDGGDIKSQVPYRAGFRATGLVDANAIFNTQTAGISVETLTQGALYLEMQGDTRPVLAKGLYPNHARIRQAAVDHAPYCGPVDAWTAQAMSFYAERWTRLGQQEFLRSLNPNAVRTVPGAPIAAQPAGVDLGDVTSEVRDEGVGDMRAAEIEQLDALYAADAYRPHRVDPTLPPDTRHLLEAIAGSDLLYGDAKYVPTRDLLDLAAEVLGWPSSETAGGRRIAAALKAVNVTKAEPRPYVNKVRMEAYLTEELKAAVDKNVI
jgi:hypothetical protein